MGRHGARERRSWSPLIGGLLALVVVGLLAWRGAVAVGGDGPFVPGMAFCAESPTVTVTTTAAMEPVVREVVDGVSGACATFRVTAESPDATARRFAEEIPVTFVDGQQHDFWRVDEARLTRALTG